MVGFGEGQHAHLADRYASVDQDVVDGDRRDEVAVVRAPGAGQPFAGGVGGVNVAGAQQGP
ncbi:hypothetical protein GCM10027614_64910 [Micromonospora vulcania]